MVGSFLLWYVLENAETYVTRHNVNVDDVTSLWRQLLHDCDDTCFTFTKVGIPWASLCKLKGVEHIHHFQRFTDTFYFENIASTSETKKI